MKMAGAEKLPPEFWRIRDMDIDVRLARISDAPALHEMNGEFNGEGLSTPESIAESLARNENEVVVCAATETEAVGFCCFQIKKSMCYEEASAELAEMYVREKYRRMGVAKKMIELGEKYCAEKFGAKSFTVLTGKENFAAQALYKSIGYAQEDEIMLAKEILD